MHDDRVVAPLPGEAVRGGSQAEGARARRRYVLQVDLLAAADPEVHGRVDALLARAAAEIAELVPGDAFRVERLAGTLTDPDPGSDGRARRHRVPPLEVDLAARRVFVGEQPVQLAFKEFEILEMLLRRPGEVVTRSEIVEGLAACDGEPPAYRTIDVHVHRIRAKLDACGDCIATVRGLGYRFNPSSSVVVF